MVVRSGVASVRLDGVGEQRPARPGALAVVAFRAAAAQAVTAFPVRGPPGGASPVAGERSLRPLGAGRGAAGADGCALERAARAPPRSAASGSRPSSATLPRGEAEAAPLRDRLRPRLVRA